MGSYILRRLLLIIPTLLGVMIVNFALIQFVPGGPIDQVIAQLEGDGDVFAGISGGGSEAIGADTELDNTSQGARGLPPQFLESLQVEFNFARIVCDPAFEGVPDLDAEECFAEDIPMLERFGLMMWDYLRFDFGESYFRSIGVLELVQEKLPVSITLGLWSTLIAYIISIPLGIRKAVRDGSTFDSVTSGLIIVAYAIPGFLFAIMLLVLFAGGRYLQWFPLRGLTSDGFEDFTLIQQIGDYFWHITLPVVANTIAAFATLTLLTKNSFLDEIKKQYVMTAKAKGLPERRVMYGHVFRNAMLIVIAGFPAVFVGVFFGGSLIIETIFSLDGLGRLGFEAVVSRDYPVMFGTLYVFGLVGLTVGILSDLMYVWIDPRIDFETREG
ncbi:microcin C ABC transporter permease YejB [Gymnodinialimonas sp.]